MLKCEILIQNRKELSSVAIRDSSATHRKGKEGTESGGEKQRNLQERSTRRKLNARRDMKDLQRGIPC
ncbi:MAG: hypothetical protein HXS52_10600 [Theionarchaea archaeon]|nr:hypothetical protein [Theionarchaea archaeon]